MSARDPKGTGSDRSRERQEQILAAALETFGERGLAGARLEEIARRAGIAKGTVYLYFESKDELFRAVARRTFVEGVQRIVVAKRAGPVELRLRELLAAFWDYIREPSFQAIYRLVLGELHQFPELVRFFTREISGRMSSALIPLLEEGSRTGVFRSLEPATTAQMILALLLQQALWSERRQLFQTKGRSDEEVFADVVEFYSRAIGDKLEG
jgi:AcrR family transcriptional regulator